MSTEVLISRSAAEQIFAEVRRWVERGFAAHGVPLESLMYPLSALIPSGPLLTPLEPVGAEHLREVVIDEVAIPPDEVKAFSPANCHFESRDLEGASASFNRLIDGILARRPRLGVHSKLHSHPFAGGGFLSGGDLHHGATSEAAVRWREQQGLSTAILHVVHPDAEPRPDAAPWELTADGAIARSKRGSIRWRVRGWASCGTAIEELGDARVVSDRHPSVRASRRLPYFRTAAGARWCDAQKGALREAGYGVSRNLLGRGWRRYLLEAGGRQLLFALPPDLPATPPRVVEVVSALENRFLSLPLPGWALAPASLSALSLLRLARHYGPPHGVARVVG
jgi:hypothetical protein